MASTLGACAALTLPHWLYAFVWLRPVMFMSLVKQVKPNLDPVRAFATLASGFKLWQALVFFSWYASCEGSWPHMGTLRLFLGLGLVVVGQILNVSIYHAIGENGVYYGTRLGKTVKWHEGFPFTVTKNPQYVGATLSIWGIAVLLYTHASAGILVIGATISACYAISAYIEEFY